MQQVAMNARSPLFSAVVEKKNPLADVSNGIPFAEVNSTLPRFPVPTNVEKTTENAGEPNA
jgi:hypothetical protein